MKLRELVETYIDYKRSLGMRLRSQAAVLQAFCRHMGDIWSLATTSRYLKIATSTVCATTSPLDLLPEVAPLPSEPTPPPVF